MTINRNPVQWDLDLTQILDKPVEIETPDGGVRRTTITDVTFLNVELDDLICPLPQRMILEDDSNDWISFDNIVRVTVL